MEIPLLTVTMMMSQILKSVDFTKTQKSRYLENKTFFLQIKKILLITLQGLLFDENSFVLGESLRIAV